MKANLKASSFWQILQHLCKPSGGNLSTSCSNNDNINGFLQVVDVQICHPKQIQPLSSYIDWHWWCWLLCGFCAAWGHISFCRFQDHANNQPLIIRQNMGDKKHLNIYNIYNIYTSTVTSSNIISQHHSLSLPPFNIPHLRCISGTSLERTKPTEAAHRRLSPVNHGKPRNSGVARRGTGTQEHQISTDFF